MIPLSLHTTCSSKNRQSVTFAMVYSTPSNRRGRLGYCGNRNDLLLVRVVSLKNLVSEPLRFDLCPALDEDSYRNQC